MVQNSWIITDDELANLLEKEGDQLWSTRYVEEIFSIITSLTDRELKKWFNIGLYGGRWTGKSSIINSLKKKLDSEENNFAMIDFDVWKYSKDDLRRSILIKLAGEWKNLKLLEKSIYQIITQNEESNKIARENIIKYIGFSILAWLLSSFLWEIIIPISQIFNRSNRQFWLSISIIVMLGTIGKEIIDKFKDTMVIRNTISFTQNSIFSTEEFEKEFKNILLGWELYDSQYKNKKIIFVFDNIDRCDSETVKEILMTIKTFLDQKNCIFILPIDYESVCKHYHTDYSQWDEYLRKIFNLWIHIKNPQYDKLYKLVETIIIKNNWKIELWVTDEEIQEISYILASVFANNPRKIKQFLNTLWAEHVWYNKEKSILALLKLLIIQQEIPKLYKYLSNNLIYADKIIAHLESFWGNYEEFNNEKKEIEENKSWISIYLKNIPKIKDREIILLHELSVIQESLPFFDWEKGILCYTISEPEAFISITKEKNLKSEAKQVIEENISLVRRSLTHAKDILNLFIYYTTEYWLDQQLFNRIFKKNSIFFNIFEGGFTIKSDILYRFISSISEDEIQKLWSQFQNWFTRFFFIEDHYKKNIDYFSKIDSKKQNHLINWDLLCDYLDSIDYIDFVDEDIENSNIFDFLKRYPRFITDKIIKTILKDIPPSIWSIWNIETFNRIKLLWLKRKLDKILWESIFSIAKNWIDISYLQLYESHASHKFIIDGYLGCVNITLLSLPERDNGIIDNLIQIYNSWIKELQDHVISIFREDFKNRRPYSWKYADFIINNNTEKEFIKELIAKTSYQKWNRKWLQDNQIQLIVNNLWWNKDDKDIVIELWKRVSTRDILIKSIMNEELEDINKKIEYLKNNNIEISKKDRENIWKEISDKIMKLLETNDVKNIEIICDFIIDNVNDLNYIQKEKIKLKLEKFDMKSFKWTFMADIYECYEDKRKEALQILKLK